MPHGHCYLWRPEILWLHVGSDFVVALSYFSIPIALGYFLFKRRDVPLSGIIVCFALFILMCGLTHVMDIYTTWTPLYGVEGILKALTALVSAYTAWRLWPMIPKLLYFPSVSQLMADLEKQKEQLFRSEEKFRSIFDQAPNGLLLVDKDGVIELSNLTIQNIFGYAPEELQGQNITVLIPANMRPGHDAKVRSFFEAPETRKMGTGRDLYGLHKEGHVVRIEVGLSSFGEGQAQRVLTSIIDITDRMSLEKYKNEMVVRLKRSNEELEQYAYAVSHDLKAPIRGVSMLSQWILEDAGGQLDETTHERMLKIQGSTHKMNGMINGILNYSKVGSGHRVFVPVDLQKTLINTWQMISPDGSVLDLQVEKPLPTLIGEQHLFEQMFQNLLSNAIKYNDQSHKTLRVTWKEDEQNDVLYFSDNGRGVDPKHHERIFELFQSLESEASLESHGVGLALVKKIVELHGGFIRLESSVGQGATFIISFPKDRSSLRLPE